MESTKTLQAPTNKPSIQLPYSDIDLYSPASLIGVLNRAISAREEKKQIYLRAIYLGNGHNREYGGYYFDKGKDACGQQSIALKTPSLLRPKLQSGSEYVFKGYVDRSVRPDGTIQVQFVICEVSSEERQLLDDKTIQQAGLLRRKQELGYRNIDQLIRQRLFQGEKPKVALLFGIAAITDKDLMAALGDAAGYYQLYERRVSMGSGNQLLCQLRETIPEDCEIVAIIRGGGSGMEVFDDLKFAETALQLNTALVTAIGHAEDSCFLDKIADRSFDTPTAFGHYLKNQVLRAEEEKCNSKAALIKEVECSVQALFKEKIEISERAIRSLTEDRTTLLKEKEDILRRNDEEKKQLHTDRQQILKLLQEEKIRAESEKRDLISRLEKERLELTKALDEERKDSEQQRKMLEKVQAAAGQKLSNWKLAIIAIFAAIAFLLGLAIGKM